MRCSNCDFENEAGATTCLNCGTVLGTPSERTHPPRPVIASPRQTQPIEMIEETTDRLSTSTTGTSITPDQGSERPAAALSGVDGSPSVGGSPSEAPEAIQSAVLPEYPAASEITMADADFAGTQPQLPPLPYAQGSSSPQFQAQIENTTFQAPAIPPNPPPSGDSFVATCPSAVGTSGWLLPLVTLLLGIVVGALITYLVIPATEYIVLDPSTEPTPASQESVAGIVLVPVPRGKAGPILPPGPDHQTQVDLRNALIASKRYYITHGNYTQETEEMAKIAPEVSWEPGITPSRPGVVSLSLCGPQEPSTALLLQAVSNTGRHFAILDQPSGPAASVYYAMAQAAFQCPNSMPPAAPWQPGLAGWGISQPHVQASPTPTIRDDRNDPLPDYAPPTARAPTTTPSPTLTPTVVFPGNPGTPYDSP